MTEKIVFDIDIDKKKRFKKYPNEESILNDANFILKTYSSDIFIDGVVYEDLTTFDAIFNFMEKKQLTDKGNKLKTLIDYIKENTNNFHKFHLFKYNNLLSLNNFLKVFISYKDIQESYSKNPKKLEAIFKNFTPGTDVKNSLLTSILKNFFDTTISVLGKNLIDKKVLDIVIENKKVKIETYNQENMVCLYLSFLADKDKKADETHYYEFIQYLKDKQKENYNFDRLFSVNLNPLIDKIVDSYLFNFRWISSCVKRASKIKNTFLPSQSLKDYVFFEYSYLDNYSGDMNKNYYAVSLWKIMKSKFKNNLPANRNKWNPADIIIAKSSNSRDLIKDLNDIKNDIETLSHLNNNFEYKKSNENIKLTKTMQKEISDKQKTIVNFLLRKINHLFVESFNKKDLIFVSLKKNPVGEPSVEYVNFFGDSKKTQEDIDQFIEKISKLTSVEDLGKFIDIKKVTFGKTVNFEFKYDNKKEEYYFKTTKSSNALSTTITITKPNSKTRYGSASIRTLDTNIFENLKNELKSLISLRIRCLKQSILKYNGNIGKTTLKKISREVVLSTVNKNKKFNLDILSKFFYLKTIFLIDANSKQAKEFINKLANLKYEGTDVLTEFRKLYYKELKAPQYNSSSIKGVEPIEQIYYEIQSYEFSYLLDTAENTIKEQIKKVLVMEIYSLIYSRGFFNTLLRDSNLPQDIGFRGCPFVIIG